MSAELRIAHGHFQAFAQARLAFVREIAALAERPEYLNALLDEDAFTALKVLLDDRVPTVQQTAAVAIGRMAGHSTELAEECVRSGVLALLDASMRRALSHAASLALATRAGEAPSPALTTCAGHLKAGAFVVKGVAKHSAELAACCLDAGMGGTLVGCLEQLDPAVREAAAGAVATLASHAGEQAEGVAAAGALPLLVAAAREPEPALKRACASALEAVAKHGAELAAAVVQAEALPVLTGMLRHAEPRVRRAAAAALVAVAKHTPELAEAAVGVRLFPSILVTVADADAATRRFSAVVLREVAKHSESLASVVVEAGGVGSLVEYTTAAVAAADAMAAGGGAAPGGAGPGGAGVTLRTLAGGATAAAGGLAALAGPHPAADPLPGVMALGFIAAFAPALASAVAAAAGIQALKAAVLSPGAEEHCRAAAVWAVGQVGKHSPEHARAVASADVLRHVQAVLAEDGAGEDLQEKAVRCLRVVIAQCDHVPALQALLPAAPPAIAAELLARLAEVLRADAEGRKGFVASGGLKVAQMLDPTALDALAAHGAAAVRTAVGALSATLSGAAFAASAIAAVAAGRADPVLAELVAELNRVFPADVVAFCRPDYALSVTRRAEAEAAVASRGGR